MNGIKEKVLMAALLAGAALSFSAGRHHHRGHHHNHRAAFEARVARVCVDAAREHERESRPDVPTRQNTPSQQNGN